MCYLMSIIKINNNKKKNSLGAWWPTSYKRILCYESDNFTQAVSACSSTHAKHQK